MCGLAVYTKTALYSNDIFTDVRCTWEECKKAGLKSFAALPLFSGNEVIGVIGLSSKQTRDFKAESGFLETLAKTVSLGITNALMYTRTKETETRLAKSEERFRRIAENAPDVIYRMSLPDGHYEYVSPAVSQIFGYKSEDFYNNQNLFKQIIHPAWLNYFKEQWTNLLTGVLLPSYEYQIIHKSGEIRWLNQRNVLINDNSGKPVALEGIVTDITKRKIAEETIIQEQQFSKSIIDGLPGIFYLYSYPDNKLVRWNKQHEKLLGFTL